MKTLAFDTSTKFLTIALMEDGDVKSEFHEDVGIKHSEILISTIKDMVEGLSWDIKDIGLMCVGVGPGSFTGLRIAIATIKGFAAVNDNKVIAVPTMDAMVMRCSSDERLVAPLLDAHKGKVYSCVYEGKAPCRKKTTEYLLMTIGDLLGSFKEKVLFFGNGIEKYRAELDSHPLAGYIEDMDWYPRGADIGRIGIKRSAEGVDDPKTIDPLYLHARDCMIKK
ncbi:MAG: tRNA (adenosine(37)-N6)-threonylcarbamoyltransferase complex dimerization subunit type 1 TsaB [Candidatus Tantalella remota]|nr:tRNA (adenosine(37)-N6)-threonylcarbamoyltransferase complex dimerization subunit type 1 TsaB [Candidatus Tantalella remota]